jgi:hypothetical protein
VKGPKNPERSFGVSVGVVLCLIAGVLWWRERAGRAEIIGVVGAILVVLGVVRPVLLKWPSALWWRFAQILGFVNARILLTVLFATILVPLSFIWRLTGKDPLARRRSSWPGWTPYPTRYRDKQHYSRMW